MARASYTPVFDSSGVPTSIIKFASDITERVNSAQEQKSVREAVSRSMVAIEFDLGGHVLTANDNLQTMGYQLTDVVGQHHSNFAIQTTQDRPNIAVGKAQFG